ncbi:MAG: hypothetical protein RIR39_2411 [Pseudomonadota bacterium]|jgi:hypothetical protein
MKNRIIFACILLLTVAGCARHVVVEPEAVGSLNSADWEIKSAPNK